LEKSEIKKSKLEKEKIVTIGKEDPEKTHGRRKKHHVRTVKKTREKEKEQLRLCGVLNVVELSYQGIKTHVRSKGKIAEEIKAAVCRKIW